MLQLCGTILCDIATHDVVADAAQSTDRKQEDLPHDDPSSHHFEAVRELRSAKTRLPHERLLFCQDVSKMVDAAAAAGDDAESPRMQTQRYETKHKHRASKIPHTGA